MAASPDAALRPESEEIEPQLKYEQLGADVRDILAKERVSCMAVSEKIVALGTDQGRVHVLDYSGNQVRLLNVHKGRVNDLSFDKEAEHLASASQDCSVAITNLYSDTTTRHEFRQPVKSVALDPRYAARKSKELVTGSSGGEVQLHTQGWLGRSDHTLAAAREAGCSPAAGVLALRWSGSLVAWAFDNSVTVYDTVSHQPIRMLRRHEAARAPQPAAAAAAAATAAMSAAHRGTSAAKAGAPASAAAVAAASGPLAGLARCSLLFAPDSHLYVAWPDTILVARITSYENNVGVLSPQVELVLRLRSDEAVLGVSPYGDDDLALLVYPAAPPPVAALAAGGAAGAGAEGAAAAGAGGAAPVESGSGAGAGAAAAGAGRAGDGAAEGNGDGSAAGGNGSEQEQQVGEQQQHAKQQQGQGRQAEERPAAPPDPLGHGRAPQLCILSRCDQQPCEWARDTLPLPQAERCGPSDYQLLPSIPQHLAAYSSSKGSNNTTTPGAAPTSASAAAAAAAAAGSRRSSQGGMVPGTTAAGRGADSGGGAGAAAVSPTASATAAAAVGTEAAAAAGGKAQRRLAPVWVDGQELMFFVVAPHAIATARSRDAADRVAWLTARRRWEEALGVAEGATGLPPGMYDRVVDGYIEELMTSSSYERAVALSGRLLGSDVRRWERFVYLFAQVRQLPLLVDHLPTESPRLRPQLYDMALQSLLASPSDHGRLLDLAKRWWPCGCFNLAALADAVAARTRRQGGEGSLPLWQLLAWLYEQQGRPDLALSIHLKLRSPAVFAFITSHGLQEKLLGRAPALLEVDERAALALLTAHPDALPPSNVVPSLQEAIRSAATPDAAALWRRRLFAYLAGLFEVDSSVAADYHELQVLLTADYQPAKLMDLLVASQYYPLEAAHDICAARGLIPEQVYVLGRMGSTDQALRLIIDRLGDIPQAIRFVVSQRDEELWGRLIDWALGSPDTTGALLDHIGGYVDPLLLVKRIPRGMAIPRLRDRLRAIITDYRTQTSLREGCNQILRSDCRHLMAKLYDSTRRALPYVYVHRQGPAGEPGQWSRSDQVHGGRLEPVAPSDVPSPHEHHHSFHHNNSHGYQQLPHSASAKALTHGATPYGGELPPGAPRTGPSSSSSASNMHSGSSFSHMGPATGGRGQVQQQQQQGPSRGHVGAGQGIGVQSMAAGGLQGGPARARGSSAPSLEGAGQLGRQQQQQQVVVLDRGAEEDWSAGLPAWARGQEQAEGGPGPQWAGADGPGGGGTGGGGGGGAGAGQLWVGFTGKSLHFGGLGGGEESAPAGGGRAGGDSGGGTVRRAAAGGTGGRRPPASSSGRSAGSGGSGSGVGVGGPLGGGGGGGSAGAAQGPTRKHVGST